MGTRVWIKLDQHSESTREASSDDSWDRGDTSTSWYVQGATMRENDRSSYYSAEYEGDLKPGDIVHLLYVVYSTGDSFGHDHNAQFDFVGVYKNHDVAAANRAELEKFSDRNFSYEDGGNNAKLKTDDGQEYDYYVPWLGYFESLGYIEIHSCTLQG